MGCWRADASGRGLSRQWIWQVDEKDLQRYVLNAICFSSTPTNTRPTVAVTDKIYVKNHRQIASQLGTRFPKGAFSGATLDVLFQGDLSELNEATRESVLEFATDFLDCNCESNPYCGHPERKFIRYLLDLRAQGLDPEVMVDVMTDDYMVYAYPGDLYSFLDNAVRTLEAVEDLAEVDGNREATERATEKKQELTR